MPKNELERTRRNLRVSTAKIDRRDKWEEYGLLPEGRLVGECDVEEPVFGPVSRIHTLHGATGGHELPALRQHEPRAGCVLLGRRHSAAEHVQQLTHAVILVCQHAHHARRGRGTFGRKLCDDGDSRRVSRPHHGSLGAAGRGRVAQSECVHASAFSRAPPKTRRNRGVGGAAATDRPRAAGRFVAEATTLYGSTAPRCHGFRRGGDFLGASARGVPGDRGDRTWTAEAPKMCAGMHTPPGKQSHTPTTPRPHRV